MREKKNKSRFKFKPNVACHPVEKIIGFYTGKEKRRYYRVQWAPSWVPEEYLVACENLIKQFFVEENIINKDSSSSNKCEIADFPLKTEDEDDKEGSTEDAPISISIDDEIPILIEADDNAEEANYVKFELKDAAKQNIAEKTDGAKEVEISQNTTEDSDSSSCEESQGSSTKVSYKQGSRAMMGSPPITDMKEKTKLPITSCSKDKIENSLRELKNKRIELEIRKRIRDLKVNSPEKISKNRTKNFVPSCVPDTETVNIPSHVPDTETVNIPSHVPDTETVNIPSCVIEETQDDTSVEMPSHTSDNAPTDQNIDQPPQYVSQNVTEHVLTPEKVLEVQTSQETDPKPSNLPNHEPESLPNIPDNLSDQIANQSPKDIPQDFPTHEPANTPDIIPEPEPNLHPQNELVNLTVKKEFVDDRKNKTYETRQRMRTLVDDDSSSDSDVPLCNLIPQSIVIKRPALASLKSTPSKEMVHIKEELLDDKNCNECNVDNFNDHNTETEGHSGAHTINADDRTDNFDVNDHIDHSNFYDDILKLTTFDNNIPIVIEDDPTPLDETNGNNSNDKLHDDCENTDPVDFSDTTSDAIDSNLNNDTNNRNEIDSKINKSNDFVDNEDNYEFENDSKMKNINAVSASSPPLKNMIDDKTNFVDNNDQDSKKKKIPLDDTDKTDSNDINIENEISHKPSDTSLKTNTNTTITTSPSPKKARGRPRRIINPNNNEDTKIIIDDKTSIGVDSAVVSPYQKHDDVNDSKALSIDSIKVQTAGDVGISEATFEDSNSCASGIGNVKTNETSSCSSFEFNKDAVSKLLLSFGSTRGKRGRGRPCKMFSPEIIKVCRSNDDKSSANGGILNSESSDYNAAHHSFVPITSWLSKRGRGRSRKIIKPECVETNRFHEKGTSNVEATSSSFVRIISPPSKRGRRRKGFNSICIEKNSISNEKSISILDNSTFDNAPTDINATSDSSVRIIYPPSKRGRRRKGFNSICIEKNSTSNEKSISILDNSTFDNVPTDTNATSDSSVRIISPPSKRGRRRKGFNSICIEKNSTSNEKSISILNNSTFDNVPTDIGATPNSFVRIISPPSKRGRRRKGFYSICIEKNSKSNEKSISILDNSTFGYAPTDISVTSDSSVRIIPPPSKRGRRRKGFNSICIEKNSTSIEKSISILNNSTFDNVPTDTDATSDSFVRIISPPSKRGRRRKGFNSIFIKKNSTSNEKSISILNDNTFDNAPTDINATSDSSVRIISPPSKRGRPCKIIKSECVGTNTINDILTCDVSNNSATTEINATSNPFAPFLSPLPKRGRKPRKSSGKDGIQNTVIGDVINEILDNAPSEKNKDAVSKTIEPIDSSQTKRRPGRPHKIFSPESVDDTKTIMRTEMSSNVGSAVDSPNKAHDTQCNKINSISKDITQKLTHPLKTEAVDDVHPKTAYRGRGRPRRSDGHVSNRTLNRHLNGVSKNMLSLKTEVGDDGHTNTKYRGRGRPRRSDCYVRKTAIPSKSRFKLLYGENEPIKIKCTNPDNTQGYSNIKEEPLSPPSNFKSFSTEMNELNKHTSTKTNEDPVSATELSTDLNESSNGGKIVNDPIKKRNNGPHCALSNFTENVGENSHSQSHINESSLSPTAKSMRLDFNENSSKTTQLTLINDSVNADNSTRKGTGSEDESFSDDSDDSESEKVFECDVCEEKFQSSVLLHRHRFIHCENQPFSFTKPKPLRCKIPRHIDVIRCKAKTKMNEDEKISIGDSGKGKKVKEGSLGVKKIKDSKPRKINKGKVKIGKTSNCKVRKIKQGRLKVGKIGKITGENCKVSKIKRNKKALKEEDSIAKAIKIEEVSTQMKEHGDDCGDNKAIEDGHHSKEKGDSQCNSRSDEDNVPLAAFDKSGIGYVPLDGLPIKKGRKIKDKSNTEEAKKVKLADRVTKALRT